MVTNSNKLYLQSEFKVKVYFRQMQSAITWQFSVLESHITKALVSIHELAQRAFDLS